MAQWGRTRDTRNRAKQVVLDSVKGEAAAILEQAVPQGAGHVGDRLGFVHV